MTAIARIDRHKQSSSTQLSSAATATAPATIDRALGVLEDRTFQASPGIYRFHQGKGPSERERAYAERAIAAIDERLDAGLDIQEAHKLVRAIIANMGQGRDSFDADSLLDGMEIAFEGRSGPAFREAVRQILSDEAPEDISRIYRPSAPQLVRMTKRVEDAWKLQRQRLKRFLDMEEAADARIDEDAPLTEAQKAMLAKMREAMPAAPRAIPSAPIVPAMRSHGASPAARIAAETAARAAARRTAGTEEGGA